MERTPTPLGSAARLAGDAGALGIRTVGGFGRWVLVRADQLDAWLHGRRALAVGVFAGAAFIGSFLDSLLWPHAPLLTALTTSVFGLLVFLLVTARVFSFRTSDGTWSTRLVFDRAFDAVSAAIEIVSTSSSAESLRIFGRVGTLLGLVTLGARNLAALLVITASELFGVTLPSIEALDAPLSWIGGLALVGGGLLWQLGRRRLRQLAQAHHLRPEGRERDQLRAATLALPVVVDTNDAKTMAAACQCGNPVLSRLFEAFSSWKRPRAGSSEDQYQSSLHRHLRKHMPEAEPERERPIPGVGRPDLIVADAVLIEMKRDLTTSGADRGVGQFWRYADAWSRGPLLLVPCGSGRPSAEQFLLTRVEALRSAARPVIVVLARSGS